MKSGPGSCNRVDAAGVALHFSVKGSPSLEWGEREKGRGGDVDKSSKDIERL